MTDQNPNTQSEQGHREAGGKIKQGTGATGEGQDKRQAGTTDEHLVKIGDDQKQQEFWDPTTANFGSPYYDPFGEEGEAEVKVGGEADRQGTTIIEAYRSTGSHRHNAGVSD